MNYRYQRTLLVTLPALLIFTALACSLPSLRQPTPSTNPTAAATALQPIVTAQVQPAAPLPTVPALPPAVVESSPLPGSVIPLDGAITLFFNQPMERASVEAALSGSPNIAGRFNWRDDQTLTFIPDAPFLPNTDLELSLDTMARSQSGLALHQPFKISYKTAGYLHVTQKLPAPGATEIDPESAIAVSFNQPVVPLGADQASLPPAFMLEPKISGKGEWLNTSTYIFYPNPPLSGGLTYTARLDPNLKSTNGGPLQTAEEWSFSVALPRLVSIEPEDGQNGVRLDSTIQMTFDQRMNPESIQASFTLLNDRQQAVAGSLAWNQAATEFTFTPFELLQRDSQYIVRFNAPLTNAGGTTLEVPGQIQWRTEPPLKIFAIRPQLRGSISPYEGIQLGLSASLPDEQDLTPFFTFIPAVTNLNYYLDSEEKILRLFGDFSANTSYVLIVSGELPDAWGGALGTPYTLTFDTNPLPPTLFFPSASAVQYLTPEDTSISAQASNLRGIYLFRGTVRLADFLKLSGPDGYNFQETYQPRNEISWFTTLYASAERVQTVEIPVSPDDTPLKPGLYFLRFDQSEVGFVAPLTLVVSQVHLTLKLSGTDALVWAVDLRTNSPVAGLSVSVFDNTGKPLTNGITGSDGVFRSTIQLPDDPFRTYYAIAEQPGDELFGLTLLNWADGIGPETFGISAQIQQPGLKTYLYTDRPIYRPGQTVYFRAVARQVRNDIYSLPTQATLPVNLYDGAGALLKTFDLPLSTFGTAHGEYSLIPEAAPGYYRLESGGATLYFQVAAYRKPEIDLEVAFTRAPILLGESLSAAIQAKYFFGAPAGDVALSWALFQKAGYFDLPDYQVGAEQYGWLQPSPYPNLFSSLGMPVAQGSGRTAPDGSFIIEHLTDLTDDPNAKVAGLRQYTLEVTLMDESGQPVSARAVMDVHPAPFYIGLRPDAWVSQAGNEIGFDVQVVDWQQMPAGSQALRGEFRKVTWVRQEAKGWQDFPTLTPQFTPISSVDFITGPDGRARLAFTPPEPGAYQLEVSGGGAVTQITLWVGGAGQAVWPNLPNQRLRLTADQAIYQPGQVAQVFIPNPYGKETIALVTVERSAVRSYQVIPLDAAGSAFSVPLSSQDAPNVYVSALLLGRDTTGKPDFRLGLVALPVEPSEQTLIVSLLTQPEQAEPGKPVTLSVRVTDSAGNPVQGEFSLSLVDKAVLALAEPKAPSILEAFYGIQPLGVRTGLALAGYALRSVSLPAGVGGGGEFLEPTVREKFPDTAYWNAEIITDANGEAQVEVILPDNLTTWQADLRGLTMNTRVGQAQAQVIVTKELLIRPVTPRFLVVGDHTMLAAVVQNNTAQELQVTVSLQASGFVVDTSQEPTNAIERQVTVPANGRTRVEWWGAVQDTSEVDLVFSAAAGELADAARPAQGRLPVLRYTNPQAFATSGLLEGDIQQLELVSLPRSFPAGGAGELRLELAPSLAASMQSALNALESYPYDCTEQVLARFLPNLEMYQTMKVLNITAPELQARLDRTLAEGLNIVAARQNSDGGWSWWQGESSDPFISAYILFGLSRAQLAGVNLNPNTIQRGMDYLMATLPTPDMTPEGWQLDRLAFAQFALAQAGSGDAASAQALFPLRDRLSPWAQALLALALASLDPSSPEASSLIADLQATATRTGNGAFWEDKNGGWRNMSTTLSTSAMVIYALAQRDPASPVLIEAVRYLSANRGASGAWNSTYETAWSLLALTEYLKGTGELSGNFSFQATINGTPLAGGQAGGDTRLNAVTATVLASQLSAETPNALTIERTAGEGRLYYSTVLDVALPVEAAAPINRGMVLTRAYYPHTAECLITTCAPIQSIAAGQLVEAALTLVLPQDAYFLLVEDYIPAGTEIVDLSLKTSAQGSYVDYETMAGESAAFTPPYEESNPFAQGWGWWLLNAPLIYDDHIAWSADYLPAGTYTLTYTLHALQIGDYRVLPARARQFYFPEVQGSSAGVIFRVTP